MELIDCPIINKKIEYMICFDISMVAEDSSPERFAPKEVRCVEDYKNICLNCPNHRYD